MSVRRGQINSRGIGTVEEAQLLAVEEENGFVIGFEGAEEEEEEEDEEEDADDEKEEEEVASGGGAGAGGMTAAQP